MARDTEVLAERGLRPLRWQRKGRILKTGLLREVRRRRPVRALSRLLLILLVIPLLLAMLVRDPHALVNLVQVFFTVGGKMLIATADLLNGLLGSGPAH